MLTRSSTCNKCGEQRLEIEMGHAVEVRFLADVVGPEDGAERLEDIVIADRVPANLIAESWRAIDQAEVTAIDVLEETFAPKFLHHGDIAAQCVVRLGMID